MKQEIGPRSLEVATFYLEHPRLTNKALAEHFGLSEARIGFILSNPRVTRHFPILARRRIQSHLLPKALERYEKIIEHSENDAVAEKAAGKVLASERVFDAPMVKVVGELTFKHVHELQQIVSKAAEQVGNDVVDAELVDDAGNDSPSATHPAIQSPPSSHNPI